MFRKSAAVACFIFLVGALFLPSLVLAGSATVTWQPNTEPDLAKYRVYWSTTAGTYGTHKAEVPKGTTTQVANGLTEGKTYYFVVTAVDVSGNESGFSSRVSKTIPGGTGAPPAPALSSPANDATVPGTSVTFKWNAVTGATNYNVRIYTEAGAIALDQWVGNILSHTVNSFANKGKAFSWRVRARNSSGLGPFSAKRTFINGTTSAVPSAPALMSPANGGYAPGTSVTFKWQAVTGATNYNVRIYTETGAIALDQWVGNILSHTVNGFSNTGKAFSWRVRARNSSGLGPFSAKRTFINGNETSSTALPAPALSFPSNGGSAPGTEVTFKWQGVQGATDYNIKIYTATGGLAFDRWVGNTQSYKVYGFDNAGKTWLWTITAKNEAGTGTVSARWSFVNK